MISPFIITLRDPACPKWMLPCIAGAYTPLLQHLHEDVVQVCCLYLYLLFVFVVCISCLYFAGCVCVCMHALVSLCSVSCPVPATPPRTA